MIGRLMTGVALALAGYYLGKSVERGGRIQRDLDSTGNAERLGTEGIRDGSDESDQQVKKKEAIQPERSQRTH